MKNSKKSATNNVERLVIITHLSKHLLYIFMFYLLHIFQYNANQ